MRPKTDVIVPREPADGASAAAAGAPSAWIADPRPVERPRRAGAYAALDLGTYNCRLLVSEPLQFGFRVLDSFSRIVRLG